MRKLIKIVLIFALLAWAAVGLRHAQGQREGASVSRSTVVSASNRPQEKITINTGDGSFVLKNPTLTRRTGSTVLKGNVVNKTKRNREQVSFEIRVYDRDGQILKGLESKIIFTAQELKANASTPINHGYGVWLQGIAIDDIARIEISEIGQGQDIPIVARMIPLASHALDLKRYSEIEK
jgi:predicted thioesterase